MQHAVLMFEVEGEPPRRIVLSPVQETVLGRSTDCTLILADERASRKHAAVFYHEGQWFLKDLKSRNGTVIGNQMIKGVVPLHAGDVIWVGHTHLTFLHDDADAATKGMTGKSDGFDDSEDNTAEGTGIFGVSEAFGVAPSDSLFDPEEIIEHRKQTSFLNAQDETVTAYVTRSGHDSTNLCQLAYQLGKTESLSEAAQLTLENLASATDADATGLWLLPQEVKSTFRVSQLRLVAHVSPENRDYVNISESLAKMVIEHREAILTNDRKKRNDDLPSKPLEQNAKRIDSTKSDDDKTRLQTPLADQTRTVSLPHHTLVAPIRLENRILGLLHLYNDSPSRMFTPEDLEYTLAVADTLGTVLSHLTREKELSAHLVDVKQENTILRELLNQETEIIGVSVAMRQVGHLVTRASEGKATLLIRGESGTGKELIARAAHFAGPRKAKPFICLNCAAISESLLASELFGHEKGAFTGATERKIGKFEAANHGTLFLDEIGEMSQSLQAKFLRVLEGHPFERVGGNTPITVDVRVVAATNRDLEKEVTEKRFRHDLFFRLRVLEIIVPPLRKRKEDIPVLAYHFLEKYCKETGRKIDGFSESAMMLLQEYRWPGNVREIKNVIERAVLLGMNSVIQESDIMLSSLRTTGETSVSSIARLPQQYAVPVMSGTDPLQFVSTPAESRSEIFEPMTLEQWERKHIAATLEYCDWNKSNSARMLGIERTTLDRKIKRYELER